MKLRSFLLVAFLAALVAAPAGYLIGRDQVGTARSAPAESEQEWSTDGLSVAELRERGLSDGEIDRVLSWREDRADMKRLEAEDAPSLTVIPDEMPPAAVAWCTEQADGGVGSVTDLTQRCAVIRLAAEGRLPGGTYTDQELAAAMRLAEAAR